MSLATEVLVFSGSVKNSNWMYPLVVFSVLVFWIMDVKYLWLGRWFRYLFDTIRSGDVDEHFEPNTKPLLNKARSVLKIAFNGQFFCFIIL